jgi:tungstate transport system substrate-binding protein
MNFSRHTVGLIVLFVLSLTSAAASEGEPLQSGGDLPRIKLATTTSTDNSGLLAEILPVFTAETGFEVDVIAAGTGRALTLGMNGDVDVVLVHARAREDNFVADGYGVNRRDVMHNDFIIVGQAEDPAGVGAAPGAAQGMAAIAAARSLFISRGDDSGTHTRERELWDAAGLEPEGTWYREAGQGMGMVLTIASETGGYTLTDRGTWLAMQHRLDLEIIFDGDPALSNPYGIIAVNPALHRHANYMGAMVLIGWITSPAGQKRIGEFTVGGDVLFLPDAVPE